MHYPKVQWTAPPVFHKVCNRSYWRKSCQGSICEKLSLDFRRAALPFLQLGKTGKCAELEKSTVIAGLIVTLMSALVQAQ
jgi:hypothetical protein